jgi:hypothetical protein
MSVTGCAVIVEPRSHAALKFVIETTSRHLPPDWPIQLFHGTQNEGFARRELDALIESKRVILHNMLVPNLTRTMYSQMLLTANFWDKCVGEHVLIFQTDSSFLPTSPHKLTDFLEWDYIGAPFHDRTVGNGGFSLRKKSSSLAAVKAMTESQRQGVRAGNMHEDIYFANFFKHHPVYRLAPVVEAQKFSVESMYYATPLGVHQPWTCIGLLGISNYQKLLSANPVLQQLIRLNHHNTAKPVEKSRTPRFHRSHTPRHQKSHTPRRRASHRATSQTPKSRRSTPHHRSRAKSVGTRRRQ